MKISENIRRIILLMVLALEGIGGVLGGVLLIAAPDGQIMKMPVEIMHGFFPNFLIPGITLTGMGVLNLAAFISVLSRRRFDWIIAGVGLIGFTIWFIVEIVILQELHWLHIVSGVPVLVGIWAALPLIPSEKLKKITQ